MIKAVGITNGKAVSLYNRNALLSLFFFFNPLGLLLIVIGILFAFDETESIVTTIIFIIIGLFFSIGIFLLPLLMRKTEQKMIDNGKQKQEHILIFEQSNIFIDNIEIKFDKKSIVYIYKDFIFLVFNKINYNFYIINDISYIEGNRKMLLKLLSKNISIRKGK